MNANDAGRIPYGTIDDAARAHGDGLAISLAVGEVRRQYDRFVQRHPKGSGAVFVVKVVTHEPDR